MGTLVTVVGYGLDTSEGSPNDLLAREARNLVSEEARLLLEFPIESSPEPDDILCRDPFTDPHSAVRVIREAANRTTSLEDEKIFVINEIMVPSFLRQLRNERSRGHFEEKTYSLKVVNAGYSRNDPQFYVRDPLAWSLRDWGAAVLAALGISLYR